MADRPPLSVLLPTTRWTEACTELAAQFEEDDELLVIHDDGDDTVTGRDAFPDGVRLIAAGEPEGCSGKANAIVAGMEAARHDRLVWSDDDFRHPPDWLATLSRDYDEHGPVSEVPYFVGRDPLSVLLEPMYASGGSLPISVGPGDHGHGLPDQFPFSRAWFGVVHGRLATRFYLAVSAARQRGEQEITPGYARYPPDQP